MLEAIQRLNPKFSIFTGDGKLRGDQSRLTPNCIFDSCRAGCMARQSVVRSFISIIFNIDANLDVAETFLRISTTSTRRWHRNSVRRFSPQLVMPCSSVYAFVDSVPVDSQEISTCSTLCSSFRSRIASDTSPVNAFARSTSHTANNSQWVFDIQSAGWEVNIFAQIISRQCSR